ncbi:cysteine methyltransferase [Streptomyces cinnamoneus]|uniref:Methylated-DNA--protein-cysteine methyltransferase n=1 Tax=Streptomyces cinnamoneus TaxID=53446 RepID=A0A2G1X9Z0_STRCJ|nr:methylated-DNA--[protein]-cysteine S-methyltransferase [Streptomyces cinnamoneus]PHQ48040.1 cysteine methyltransferase [Streptomyces cinnamoneus]PPT15666.1 methylated-DNA--[protein]-cysteine S-methyltransferase [Streptomyces cinnamoneus]
MLYTEIDSPLGRLLLTGRPSATAPGGTALVSLSVPEQRNAPAPGPDWRREPAAFGEAARQLAAYFAGETRDFALEFAVEGTEFRRKVWDALDAVPYGATTSYGQLAARIGAPRAAVRAVGGAIGANPLLVLRPCHRVIGADGSLTGYAGGLDRKRHLLALEGAL